MYFDFRFNSLADPKLGLYISLLGNLVGFDPYLLPYQMGRNKRRKHWNLNGLHEEVVAPPPRELSQLPPPTTPLQDMWTLVGGNSIPHLLNNTVQRHGFL